MSLDLAIAHALTNPVQNLPRMAAVIMDGRRIVSRGYNSRKTHPLAAKYGKTPLCLCVHAELAAIVAAKEPVAGMTMFVARVYRDGRSGMARPCEGCWRALAAFGINDVRWTV